MKGNVNLKNEKIEKKEKNINELEEDEPPLRGSSWHHRKCVLDIESEYSCPFNGRVLVVGILETDSQRIRIFFDRDEEVMLRRVIRCFDEENYTQLIGYNIGHDLRCLLARFMKYRLSAASIFSVPCYDVMIKLKKIRNDIAGYHKSGSLDEWSHCVLGEGKKEKTGSVSSLYHQNKVTELIEYNKQDLLLTYRLWNTLCKVLGAKETREEYRIKNPVRRHIGLAYPRLSTISPKQGIKYMGA